VFFDIFSSLCQEKGISTYKACIEMGLNRSAVAKWKNGGTPNGATISKMADYFGVSTDYLLGSNSSAPKEKALPELTEEDKQDVAKTLENTLDQLMLRQDGLMFDGEPLDDVTRELLETSLRNSIELAKRISKAREASKNQD